MVLLLVFLAVFSLNNEIIAIITRLSIELSIDIYPLLSYCVSERERERGRIFLLQLQ